MSAAPAGGGAPPLAGWRALVTGGGSGIGLACAVALARDGARVTICGRSAERLETGAKTIADEVPGAQVVAVPCDVTSEAEVAEAVRVASDDGAGLEAVVASAGGGGLNRLEATTLDEWQSILGVVLTGVFLTFKHSVAPMAAVGGGAMVAISSVAGVRTHRFMTPYSVAKAGLDMLVRNAADELGDRGIRVNSVRPGLTETELVGMITTDDTMRTDYLAQMPISRIGTVDDVAALVRFLVGPESSWITGETVSVDGGHHLRRGPDFSPWAGPPPG